MSPADPGQADLHFRPPRPEDGAAIRNLVAESSSLDINSDYFYLLFCCEFARTSQVAVDHRDGLVGMMLGLRPPERPDTLFVWQIATDPRLRRQGLARRLILATLTHPDNRDVAWLEATVTPSNAASQSLFTRLGTHLSAPLERSDYLDRSLFPDAGHEPEILFRIGPFQGIPGYGSKIERIS